MDARITVTHLNQIFALGLGDEWLELWRGEGIDETGFRDHEQKDLRASKDRQFVSLCGACQSIKNTPKHGGKRPERRDAV